MSIEKQIADQVRNLPDKTLLEMALAHGFSLALKKPNGVARSFTTTGSEKTAKSLKKVAVAAAKAAAPPKEDPKHVVLAKLQQAGAKGLGMSTSELVDATGLSKGKVVKGLKEQMAEGNAFRAGDRRFTRYADSQKIADDASVASKVG